MEDTFKDFPNLLGPNISFHFFYLFCSLIRLDIYAL